MTVAITDEGAVKCISAKQFAGLLTIPDFPGLWGIMAFPVCNELREPFTLTGLGGHFCEAILEVALNVVLFDALADDVIAAPLDVPEHIGDALAMFLANFLEAADPVNEL